MRSIVATGLQVLGLVLIVGAVAFWSWQVAAIVAGGLFIAASVRVEHPAVFAAPAVSVPAREGEQL